MSDWVYMWEDEPLLDKGCKRCSVGINVLTDTDKVISDCYMTLDDKKIYNKHGKRVKEEVIAWQTM